MTIRNDVLESHPPSAQPRSIPATTPAGVGWAGRLLRELAFQDWLVLTYLTILTIAVAVQPASPLRSKCLGQIAPVLAFSALTLVVVRGGLLRDRILAPLGYRLAVHGTVQLSYFLLRDLLPLVSPGSLDPQLAQLDMQWFGWEPSLWMDRLITPGATEWFAFFYFGYFPLLAVHVLPMVYFSKRTKLLSEFALGVLLCFSVGHLCYAIVPGYGPVQYLAHQYQQQFPQGFWMRLVLTAVDTGGAQKDIFPSIHTALPVFLALFSFRHRKELPFKYTWPAVTFFAANIVIATMYLRWHYLIDVVAGLALATLVFTFCARFCPREVRRRELQGLSPIWQPILARRTESC